MKYHIHKNILKLLILFLLVSYDLLAKDIPPRPNTAVVDYIGLLTPAQRQTLERKLKTFNDTSSSAIVVVIDDSTEGEDIFDYSYRLASKWGIGAKGKDNGLLMYIAFNDRKVYIQVGSGLEGAIPDNLAKRVIENIIKPAFRNRRFYEGIDKATDVFMSLASGEFTADEYMEDSVDILGLIIFFIFLIIFISVFISVIKCKKSGDCNDGGGYSGDGRYNTGGGWIIGGGFGGGGFGGSSGGGGFGGFGGGGFSGGGAGGGW